MFLWAANVLLHRGNRNCNNNASKKQQRTIRVERIRSNLDKWREEALCSVIYLLCMRAQSGGI